MTREIVSTDNAPAAIGPYSQANKAGGFLYTAGQIPLDPATMEVVGETAAEQCRQAMTNAGEVLKAAGLDPRTRRHLIGVLRTLPQTMLIASNRPAPVAPVVSP